MRRAASLLELVIAIVVMGIAMMTLPMMLTTTQSNNIFAIQQEAILIARTQLGDMLTYLWDENSIDSNGVVAVLDTNSSYSAPYSDFERVGTSTRRVGHVEGNKRRKYFSATTYATDVANLGTDANDNGTPDDIDDFDANITTTGEYAESADIGFDYKFDLNMSISVSYINDDFTEGSTFNFGTSPSAISTNTKMTVITLKGDGADNNKLSIIFRAYSCNIGANQLLRRDF